MKTALIAAATLVAGFALGVSFSAAALRRLRKRIRDLRAEQGGKPPVSFLRSVTNLLFVTSQLAALVWVSISYGIAIYSTVALSQPFPVVELSQQAITTILGVTALKVVENIFEHNDGVVFGNSKQDNNTPPEGDEQEGVG